MPTQPILDVVCLCAAWCGTCREYEAVFASLQEAMPAHRYRWIDIEDEADLVGDVDVETFPTLLVSHQGTVMFAGPVLPRLGDAQRLVAVQAEQAQQVEQAQPVQSGQPPSAALQGLPPDQAAAFSALALRLTRAAA